MFDHFHLYRYNGEVGDVVVGRIIEVRITPQGVCSHGWQHSRYLQLCFDQSKLCITVPLFLSNNPTIPFFPIPHCLPIAMYDKRVYCIDTVSRMVNYIHLSPPPPLGAAETLEGVYVLTSRLSAPTLICQLAWGCVEASWGTGWAHDERVL